MHSSISSSDCESLPKPRWRADLTRSACFLLLLFVLDRGIGIFLHAGIERYFGLDRPADIVCVGYSRTLLGIDPDLPAKRTGLRVAVYAVNGATQADRHAMVQQFLSEHPETKLLIYDVEAPSFSSENLSSNSYTLFFPFIENPFMNSYLRRSCDSWDEYWLRRVCWSCRYNEVTLWLAIRGWLGLHKNLKYGDFDPARFRWQVNQGKTQPVDVEPEEYRLFMQTIKFATRRGVHVLLVNMPTVDLLNARDKSGQEAVFRIFRCLAKNNPLVLYADYHRAFQHRYGFFYDAIHLNGTGQRALTGLIASYIVQARLWPPREQRLASH